MSAFYVARQTGCLLGMNGDIHPVQFRVHAQLGKLLSEDIHHHVAIAFPGHNRVVNGRDEHAPTLPHQPNTNCVDNKPPYRDSFDRVVAVIGVHAQSYQHPSEALARSFTLIRPPTIVSLYSNSHSGFLTAIEIWQ